MPSPQDTQELPTTPPVSFVPVFDKDGNQHKMSRLNAYDMVQHCGWVWTLPASVAAKPVPSVRVVISKKAAPAPDAAVEDTENVDLHNLTHEALIKFAKDHFDMDFAPEVSREAIINAILVESE